MKGIAYDVNEILPSKAGKARAVSPTGKFPVLDWGDERIVDSTDIMRFLDERAPTPPLYPDTARARALAHIIEDWADESLYYYDLAIRSKPHNAGLLARDVAAHETGFTQSLMHRLIPSAARKIAASQGLGRKSADDLDTSITEHFAALDALLEADDYLCGDRISAADIAVVCMIFVLIRAREPAAALPKFPRVVAWRDRVDLATGKTTDTPCP